MVHPGLGEAVDRLPDATRRIVAYHLGWSDVMGNAKTWGAGRAIRPAIVLLTSEAAGGAVATAVPAAVAVELVHNFSLLHDDLMDGDEDRRHRPTAWKAFGRDAAMLAGDALLASAFGVLAAGHHPMALWAVENLTAVVHDMIDGQSADAAFEIQASVSVSESLGMARKKTGALFRCACAMGAAYGNGTKNTVTHFERFGEQLGLAFQLVNDISGIWGDMAITGKPLYSDLKNRKKSLPVAAALTSGAPASHELAALYRQSGAFTEDDLIRAADLIENAGGRAWSQQQASLYLAEALQALALAQPAARAAGELTELARLLISDRNDPPSVL